MNRLLKLLQFEFKSVFRDKGFLAMSFFVLPILVPALLIALVVGMAVKKNNDANNQELLSDTGNVVAIINSKSHPVFLEFLPPILTDKHGHQLEYAVTDNEIRQLVRSGKATYGISTQQNSPYKLNFYFDKERHNNNSNFMRDLDNAKQAYRTLIVKRHADSIGLTAEDIKIFQSPVSSTTINVADIDSSKLSTAVIYIVYLLLLAPLFSSQKFTYYAISQEHNKKWSYIPVLGSMALELWIGAKILAGTLWGGVISFLGLIIIKISTSVLSDIGMGAISSMAGKVDAQLSLSGMFQIWIIGVAALIFLLTIMSILASYFHNPKVAAMVESSFSTVIMLSVLMNEPHITTSGVMSYIVPPFSTNQLVYDLLSGNFITGNLLAYMLACMLSSFLLLKLSAHRYRLKLYNQQSFNS